MRHNFQFFEFDPFHIERRRRIFVSQKNAVHGYNRFDVLFEFLG